MMWQASAIAGVYSFQHPTPNIQGMTVRLQPGEFVAGSALGTGVTDPGYKVSWDDKGDGFG